MIIQKLKLQNFRSHTETVLDLAPLTVIRGANASGKSSIENALQITLAGRTDSTSADGKGSASLIRLGEKKALVKMAVEANGQTGLIECALSGSSRAVLATVGGDDWKDYLGFNRDVLSCLCNNRFFVDLTPKAQADILASIILPSAHTWADWVQPAVRACGLNIVWTQTPFDAIKQGYERAFEERTIVNRELKNFRMPEGDTSEAAKLEQYSRDAASARQDLDAAQKSKYELTSESRRVAVLLQAAGERLAAAQGRLSREEQDVDSLQGATLSPAKLKEYEKTAKNADKARKLDADIAEADAELAVTNQALKALNDISAKPACPTCGSEITEAVIARIAAPLVDRKNAAAAKRQELIDLRRSLGNPVEAQAALDANKRAQSDMEKAKARISEERTAIADAEAKIAELKGKDGVDPITVSKADERIAHLVVEVEGYTQKIARARAARDLAGRVDAARAEREALTRKQGQLERLVEYFGTTVKAELLAVSVGPFADAMNAVLAEWGYHCTLSIEPYAFTVNFGQYSIALDNLSKSQRYRFAVAFQVALAVVSGFGFVVVDEADIFDQAGRNGLFTALTSGQLDQAIVLATDERTDVPDVDGAVFYMLEDAADEGELPTTRARVLVPELETV